MTLAAPIFMVSVTDEQMLGTSRLGDVSRRFGPLRVDRLTKIFGHSEVVRRLGGKRLLRLMRDAERQHRRSYADSRRHA